MLPIPMLPRRRAAILSTMISRLFSWRPDRRRQLSVRAKVRTCTLHPNEEQVRRVQILDHRVIWRVSNNRVD